MKQAPQQSARVPDFRSDSGVAVGPGSTQGHAW